MVNSLTPMGAYMNQLFFGLRKFVITSQIFVLKASRGHQNLAEVFSWPRRVDNFSWKRTLTSVNEVACSPGKEVKIMSLF
jgi:hypothetical protein